MNTLRSTHRKDGSKPAISKGQEKRIKELEQTIKNKDHRIDELRHELKRYAQELGKREQDIKLLLKNDRRWTEFKDFVEKAMENKAAIEKDDLKRDMKELTAANEVLLKNFDDLRTERDGIYAEWKKTGEALRNVQASAFRFQDQPEWAPDSDESIRHELKSLESSARAWCNENCIKALSMLRMTPDALLNEWGLVMRYDGKVFAKNDQHLPQLILLALLMDYIYGNIFAKPFWFLPWRIMGADAEEGTNKVLCRGLHEGLAGVLEETTQGAPQPGELALRQF
ncbi:hypothetical protein N7507_002305 [Penicillium longicatenatum]|nr:hypothetical protein N7507_002305 [Penicillium longicatenatum]